MPVSQSPLEKKILIKQLIIIHVLRLWWKLVCHLLQALNQGMVYEVLAYILRNINELIKIQVLIYIHSTFTGHWGVPQPVYL